MRRMYSKPQLLEAVEQESKINGIKVFEDIKDKDGHARFIEGTLTQETISGITPSYSKWALSGTHLLIVVCGTIANATALSSTQLVTIDVPKWILDKVSTIYSNVVTYHSDSIYGSDGTTQTINNYLAKLSNSLAIQIGSITTTKERIFRFAYDLLIDNE